MEPAVPVDKSIRCSRSTGSRLERFPLRSRQLQGICQQLDRIVARGMFGAALDLSNRPFAQARMLGQRFLGQSQLSPIPSD
jgi:hypothetical protein